MFLNALIKKVRDISGLATNKELLKIDKEEIKKADNYYASLEQETLPVNNDRYYIRFNWEAKVGKKIILVEMFKNKSPRPIASTDTSSMNIIQVINSVYNKWEEVTPFLDTSFDFK